ncbi:unnamed protein product [Angiostrongylus costaricensis]|uniref:RCK N-terminal domain-containing protein n=1 Tax=Angiostrongylus costaricensis TaxID=334426 RepID=A0A0R3PI27_ANGCS|nr:unnamed protein product [Angiostrongylus costaricensis]
MPICETAFKKSYPNGIGLHFGVVASVNASVLLTETFEKFCLRARMKTIFCLIRCLYSIIAAFYVNEMSKKLHINGTQWIDEMSTPVCTLKDLNSREICDIPFNRMNLSTVHKILVIGNSYAANQGQIVHEMCANSDVVVKIFQQNASEVLRVTEYSHCGDSRTMFHEAVHQYKPNVLFILTRDSDENVFILLAQHLCSQQLNHEQFYTRLVVKAASFV